MSDAARHNMIEQQIRTWDVLDDAVLALYADDTLRREDFIADPGKKALAYADLALPIAHGQAMLEPKQEARMLQALRPTARETILHIGCGSGFFAALLGRLARQVVSVESRPALAQAAAARLAAAAPNVAVVTGDGAGGWPDRAPYDAIVYTAGLAALPPQLAAQLKDGGRLLAFVGEFPVMSLQLLQKQNGELCLQRAILEAMLPMLDNAPAAETFSF